MATYEDRTTEALGTRVAQIENDLRDARGAMARLAQALDHAHGQNWELTGRINQIEDAIKGILPQLAVLPKLEDHLRGLRELLSRVQDQGIVTAGRLGEVVRQVDSAAERERQALNEMARRLDSVERQTQGVGARFDASDEANRRAMEAVALLRQRIDEVGRTAGELETRLARLAEGTARVDHEFGRVSGELDSLRKQDEVLAERVQVYTEMIKRLEGQLSLVAADVAVKHDVIEAIDLQRVASHRIEERLSGLEATVEGLHERDEEASRQLLLLDGRQKGFQERLAGLQNDVAVSRGQVNEQFQRLQQLQERLKRRQLEELERDLREMRIHAFKLEEAWERRDDA